MGISARSTLHEGFKQVEGMERELKIKVRLLDTFTETFFLPNHCFILNSTPSALTPGVANAESWMCVSNDKCGMQ